MPCYVCCNHHTIPVTIVTVSVLFLVCRYCNSRIIQFSKSGEVLQVMDHSVKSTAQSQLKCERARTHTQTHTHTHTHSSSTQVDVVMSLCDNGVRFHPDCWDLILAVCSLPDCVAWSRAAAPGEGTVQRTCLLH